MDHSKNFHAGHVAEQNALRILRKRNLVEDRSSWACDPTKPYAMDFYWPEKRVAADFKFKTLNERYKAFYLEEGHYDKYCHYVSTDPGVDAGYLWYVDRTSKQEYLISLKKLTALIVDNKVSKHYNKKYKSSWESGYFYAIPIEHFKNITNEEYSLTQLEGLDNV